MSGWTNKGRAKPGWMQCPHISGPDGLCTGCGATEIPGWRQNEHAGRGAVGLNDAEPVMKSGTDLRMKGDESSKDRFMRGSAHVDKETRRRAA